MTSHELKTWPDYFEAVLSGAKAFEVRKDDRNFQVGDNVALWEYWPVNIDPFAEDTTPDPGFTGRWIHAVITYKLGGGSFGIEYGYCVLGLRVTGNSMEATP